jgi:hypothetical protein
MFNKICVKDEYLINVSFLKYSGLLDYLVYCFPPVCIGWKFAVIKISQVAEGVLTSTVTPGRGKSWAGG